MPEFNIPITIHLNVRVVVGEPEQIEAEGSGSLSGRWPGDVNPPRPAALVADVYPGLYDDSLIEAAAATLVRSGTTGEEQAGFTGLQQSFLEATAARSDAAAAVEPPPRRRRGAGRPSNAERAAAALRIASAGEDGPSSAPADIDALYAALAPDVAEVRHAEPHQIVGVTPHPEDVAPVAASLVPVTLEEATAAANAFMQSRGMPELQRILQIEIGVPRIRDLNDAQRADLLSRITL